MCAAPAAVPVSMRPWTSWRRSEAWCSRSRPRSVAVLDSWTSTCSMPRLTGYNASPGSAFWEAEAIPAVPPKRITAVAAATSCRSRLPLLRTGGGGGAVCAECLRRECPCPDCPCSDRPASTVSASAISRSRRPRLKSVRGEAAGSVSTCRRNVATAASSRSPSGTPLEVRSVPSTSAAKSSARCRVRNTVVMTSVLRVLRRVVLRGTPSTTYRSRRLRGSPGLLRQELGQVADRPQLQLLDRPVAAAEHLGGLRDRQPLQEAHDQALLLLVRQRG